MQVLGNQVNIEETKNYLIKLAHNINLLFVYNTISMIGNFKTIATIITRNKL